MRTKIEVVQNDKLYDLVFVLQDANGTALDVSDASILINVQKQGDSELKFSGQMTTDEEVAGKCAYQVQDGDFDEIGTYNAEIQVTFSEGQVSTYSDIIIVVFPELPKT